jgi:hypothetical protein
MNHRWIDPSRGTYLAHCPHCGWRDLTTTRHQAWHSLHTHILNSHPNNSTHTAHRKQQEP